MKNGRRRNHHEQKKILRVPNFVAMAKHHKLTEAGSVQWNIIIGTDSKLMTVCAKQIDTLRLMGKELSWECWIDGPNWTQDISAFLDGKEKAKYAAMWRFVLIVTRGLHASKERTMATVLGLQLLSRHKTKKRFPGNDAKIDKSLPLPFAPRRIGWTRKRMAGVVQWLQERDCEIDPWR